LDDLHALIRSFASGVEHAWTLAAPIAQVRIALKARQAACSGLCIRISQAKRAAENIRNRLC